MTPNQLKILLQEGEGTMLEYKESIRRNPLIADLLHRIEFIEKAGTGIKRIRDEVREQGCPEPDFETNGFFTVIFRPNPDVAGPS